MAEKDAFGSPIVTVRRRETFSASHRLHAPQLSDEENASVYGKCNHVHGHGHNYTVLASVSGPVDPITGMVINLVDLKKAMHAVLEELDHRNLDMDVPFFRTHTSTVENLTVYVWNRLRESLPSQLDIEIEIHETENNVAIYRGNDAKN